MCVFAVGKGAGEGLLMLRDMNCASQRLCLDGRRTSSEPLRAIHKLRDWLNTKI